MRQLLSQLLDGRLVIQDFLPLSQSIEWKLGQLYWNERGAEAFVGGDVPYLVNNDGYLSSAAAKHFFSRLRRAEGRGELPPGIYVLELGTGTGLFARLFIESFRVLCEENRVDWFERFTYLATDRSEQMLSDIRSNGILSDHPGQHELYRVDGQDLRGGLNPFLEAKGEAAPFQAVFLNYALDQMPAAILSPEGANAGQLCVRTCLPRGFDLQEHTSFGIEQLVERAASSDIRAQKELIDLYEFFVLDSDFKPVAPGELPYLDFARKFGQARSSHTLLNHGAIDCLDQALELLKPSGFILINDYPEAPADAGPEAIHHQRFGGSTQIGINFSLLKAYFDEQQGAHWIEPEEDSPLICARLLAREVVPGDIEAFHGCFGKAPYLSAHAAFERARAAVAEGGHEAGLRAYTEALDCQPRNWLLVGEVAEFLMGVIGDYDTGLEMTRRGLALNPISPTLWNILGGGLLHLGRSDEARQAFLRAIELSPRDVRARYNLVYIHQHRKDYAAALRMIADGLLLDTGGEYRDRLLASQAEVLTGLSAREEELATHRANRLNWVGERHGEAS